MRNRVLALLFVLAVHLAVPAMSGAQWVQTNGPGGGAVSALAVKGTKIFAGTEGGIFVSVDNGASWKAANAGLPRRTWVTCLGVSGPNVLAGIVNEGLHFSQDEGANWVLTTAGLPADVSIHCFEQIGPVLFAGTWSHGVLLSHDNGANWTADGTTWPVRAPVEYLAAVGPVLFAGTHGGWVFKSADNGKSWVAAGPRLDKKSWVTCLAESRGDLFAGTDKGLYVSKDNGANWKAAKSGLPGKTFISYLLATGTDILAGTAERGVFRSMDNGISWAAANSGLPADCAISSCAATGTTILTGLGGIFLSFRLDGSAGVYRSEDGGASWQASNSGMANTGVSRLARIGPYLFASLHSQGFLSTDDGASWAPVGSKFPGIKWIEGHAEAGPYVFARTDRGIIRFRDNGTGWEMLRPGLPVKGEVWHLAACSTTLFASTPRRVFQSDDYGASWEEVAIGLSETLGSDTIRDLAVAGEDLFALVGGEGMHDLYVSVKDSPGWKDFKVFPKAIEAHCLAVSGETLFVGGMGGIYAVTHDGIKAKFTRPGPAKEAMVACFGVCGRTVIAVTSQGVLFSTDDGDTWAAFPAGLPWDRIQSLEPGGKYLFAGTGHSGVWRLPLADMFLEKR